MNKETKSIVKVGAIALLVMAVVMFGLYQFQSAPKKSHSHGDGKAHTH